MGGGGAASGFVRPLGCSLAWELRISAKDADNLQRIFDEAKDLGRISIKAVMGALSVVHHFKPKVSRSRVYNIAYLSF